MPLVPRHRIENCPRLLLCGGGLFAAFLGPVPSWPLSFCGLVVCLRVHGLGRAFLAVGLSFVSCLFSSRAWLLFVALFVVFVLLPAFLRMSFPLALVCLSWCGGAPLRLSFSCCCWLPSSVSCCLPPPVVGPLWCPGPVFVLVPPSGYLVAFATAPLPCLNAWVSWCSVVLSSSCLIAAKVFDLCGVCITLYTMLQVLWRCSVLLR